MRMQHTKKLVTLAMLSALAYAAVFSFRIPVILFLKYEPKDVVLAIGGFLYGPLSVCALSVVVSLLEMATISGTGAWGCLMNIVSSCSFATYMVCVCIAILLATIFAIVFLVVY